MTADRPGSGRLGNLVLPPGVEVGWQQDAACKDVPEPDVFFPGKGEDAEAAKRICAGCPVLVECLAFALATMRAADRDHGVYGGLTPAERARLRGGPALHRAPRLDSQVQAVIGHRLANRVGLASAARALGVTPEALAYAWQRRGTLSPPSQPSRQPSVGERLYQDRAWAKQALALVGQLGILNLPRFPGRFLFAWVVGTDGHAQPCLILHWAQVAKRGVPPGPVVDGLEPPEHLQAGLLTGVPVAPVDQLALQGRKEALDERVVEAIAHRPIDARIPSWWSLLPNARLVNCAPWSE